jgi:ribosomal protein L37AE/L43A
MTARDDLTQLLIWPGITFNRGTEMKQKCPKCSSENIARYGNEFYLCEECKVRFSLGYIDGWNEAIEKREKRESTMLKDMGERNQWMQKRIEELKRELQIARSYEPYMSSLAKSNMFNLERENSELAQRNYRLRTKIFSMELSDAEKPEPELCTCITKKTDDPGLLLLYPRLVCPVHGHLHKDNQPTPKEL